MAVASGDCSMAVRRCGSVEAPRFSVPMPPILSGGTSASSCASSTVGFLQLVVPEQLPDAVVEQDVQGSVVGIAPPLLDRPLSASPRHRAMVFPDPHPPADVRLF